MQMAEKPHPVPASWARGRDVHAVFALAGPPKACKGVIFKGIRFGNLGPDAERCVTQHPQREALEILKSSSNADAAAGPVMLEAGCKPDWRWFKLARGSHPPSRGE